MTMTKREQFLIFIMGFLAIVIFFTTLFLLPMNGRISALKVEKASAESKKATIDATLPLAPGLRSQQIIKAAEVNAQLALIESPLLASQFERWILPLTSKYDMRVLSASFTEPVISTPKGMVVLVNGPDYGLKTMIEKYTGEITVVDTTPESKSTLLKSTYSYSLQTNYARYLSILDEIAAWNTTFYVTDATYSFSTGTMALTIDAYTIHKITYVGDKEYVGDYTATGDNSTGGQPNNGSVSSSDDGSSLK
jgi:hypothetical protein